MKESQERAFHRQSDDTDFSTIFLLAGHTFMCSNGSFCLAIVSSTIHIKNKVHEART